MLRPDAFRRPDADSMNKRKLAAGLFELNSSRQVRQVLGADVNRGSVMFGWLFLVGCDMFDD